MDIREEGLFTCGRLLAEGEFGAGILDRVRKTHRDAEII